jgi:hypothetical protein
LVVQGQSVHDQQLVGAFWTSLEASFDPVMASLARREKAVMKIISFTICKLDRKKTLLIA